ncbi:hypothetical protein Scep_000926 [Stephania cephalantha]|uniref:Ubiquitin carboxyl-terminal hydrolase n=1 Tax=Stephania cephalantha TaxID=152367 RepID=A0AAP0L9Q7_9MAGN
MRIQGKANIGGVLRGLRHGLDTVISSLDWLSNPRSRVIAVAAVATCLALSLKDLKASSSSAPRDETPPDSPERSSSVAGLRNHGNNCFLNVILQALASCSSFNPFIRDLIEKDGLSAEEQIESMPFAVALFSLMKDLCSLRDEEAMLNPRKVMLAMDQYIPDFNLTRQQDAAEALLHILSCLKEEFLDSYASDCTFADILDVMSYRTAVHKRNGLSECERWKKDFLGPFDGVLRSILLCQSCSSQLGMNFEYFHTLSLSLLQDSNKNTIDGYSVEDCLRKFTAVEPIESYRCSQCWHANAIKYLSIEEGNESRIDKLKCCVGGDSCDCRSLFPDGGRLWREYSSRTFKQLSIARCPKILCIHLQRAFVDQFGESVKLQSHISFPLILDLFPFTRDALGSGRESSSDNQHQNTHLNQFYLQFRALNQQNIYGETGERTYLEAVKMSVLKSSNFKSLLYRHSQAFEGGCSLWQSSASSYQELTRTPVCSDEKVNKIPSLVPSRSCMYRLVSVVEHFGKVGSGHYAAYRWVQKESIGEDSVGQLEPGYWFCISDSQVSRVSEVEVLTAEATLLFYEEMECPI